MKLAIGFMSLSAAAATAQRKGDFFLIVKHRHLRQAPIECGTIAAAAVAAQGLPTTIYCGDSMYVMTLLRYGGGTAHGRNIRMPWITVGGHPFDDGIAGYILIKKQVDLLNVGFQRMFPVVNIWTSNRCYACGKHYWKHLNSALKKAVSNYPHMSPPPPVFLMDGH